MSNEKFTVYHIGSRPSGDLEDARTELGTVGARLVELPFLDTEEEIIESASDADGLIILHAPVGRAVLTALKRCKVVMRTGVGVDTIDVEAATDLGVAVVNVPDMWSREVANHALALLLACNRRLLTLDRTVRSGQWSPGIPPPVGSLHGETLGIAGMGRQGCALAQRAAAFEMELLGYDPYIPDSVFQQYRVTRVEFDELLRRSDYVSIHCPLTPDTHHLVDEDALKAMKPTAYLINTARGPIVDEQALIRALQEGWIAGAGLDVLEEEPPSPDSPLLRMDNVVLTPHAAYYSDAALGALPARCGQEVARVLTGRMPLHLFNPQVAKHLGLSTE